MYMVGARDSKRVLGKDRISDVFLSYDPTRHCKANHSAVPESKFAQIGSKYYKPHLLLIVLDNLVVTVQESYELHDALQ